MTKFNFNSINSHLILFSNYRSFRKKSEFLIKIYFQNYFSILFQTIFRERVELRDKVVPPVKWVRRYALLYLYEFYMI